VFVAILLAGTPGCAHKRTVAPLEPVYGTLEVGSLPAGASIRIDGQLMDAITPDDFTLTAGSHRVDVALAGHTFTPASTTLVVPGDASVACTFVEYAPLLVPAEPAHAFAPQPLATTSASWCVNVTNAGNAVADSGAFVVTGADAAAFTIVSGARHPALAPGAAQPLCVTFQPSHTGSSNAGIRIGATNLALSGSGYKVPCRLTPDQLSHDFGTQVAGQVYSDWCFTIRNDDTATCADTLQIAGANPGEFAITSGAAYDLAAGASQQICVAYRPTVAGGASASITAGSNTVTLSATGVGSCAIGSPVTPDGTDFGERCTEAAITSRRLVVSNSGNLPCAVRAISSRSAVFPVAPSSASVPAGGSATFTVEFHPVAGDSDSTIVSLLVGAQRIDTKFTGVGASAPAADFSTSSQLRANQSITFDTQVNPNASPVTAYFWDFGDGTTSTQARPSHGFQNGGVYTVQLTVTNACGVAPTVAHSFCIEEPAYLYIWHIDQTTAPDITTNIPGWGTTTPIVLYRGTNASYGQLPAIVCANFSSGETIRTGRGALGNATGGGETVGTPGQSFADAHLPTPSTECAATLQLTLAAPTAVNAPLVYGAIGTCGHLGMGTICCDELDCTVRTLTSHCAQTGLDSRIEWGLEAQLTPAWMLVNGVKITWSCWYVCPEGAPQTHPIPVVEASPR
jgi:hypothetical protein